MPPLYVLPIEKDTQIRTIRIFWGHRKKIFLSIDALAVRCYHKEKTQEPFYALSDLKRNIHREPTESFPSAGIL